MARLQYPSCLPILYNHHASHVSRAHISATILTVSATSIGYSNSSECGYCRQARSGQSRKRESSFFGAALLRMSSPRSSRVNSPRAVVFPDQLLDHTSSCPICPPTPSLTLALDWGSSKPHSHHPCLSSAPCLTRVCRLFLLCRSDIPDP